MGNQSGKQSDSGVFTSTQRMASEDFEADQSDLVFDMLSAKDKSSYCKASTAACKLRIIRFFGEEKVEKLKSEKEGKRPVTLIRQFISALELEARWGVSYIDGKKMYTGNKSNFTTSPVELKRFIDAVEFKKYRIEQEN